MITKKKIEIIRKTLTDEYEAKLRILDEVEAMMKAVSLKESLLNGTKEPEQPSPKTEKRTYSIKHGARKAAVLSALTKMTPDERFTQTKLISAMTRIGYGKDLANRNVSGVLQVINDQGYVKRAGTHPTNGRQLWQVTSKINEVAKVSKEGK